ncbi:MAG TPA: type II toxin-antitoxin system VapC family toxin [Povalibacter sp.]|uniref:type II toxin-antitoxin system VapC family toxin n=1 Tax=Povalibacter sp. TaxID=1962978 RepID=UPI002BB1817A|nr:type II toxin-antitoxin system VapC family toxin [Povalibacter sp.]HMN45752.1 type II toxin-antitoxin system VapC family toxin [Povalibacter sp.]
MRLLLDTHLLLWALAQPDRLSAATRKQISAAEVYVSAASIWEISIKVGLGKLDADPDQILEAIEPAGFMLLPITAEHAVKVAKLPALHKDPFDRMLAAQASVEPMILLTNDEALRGYGSFVTIV